MGGEYDHWMDQMAFAINTRTHIAIEFTKVGRLSTTGECGGPRDAAVKPSTSGQVVLALIA